MSVLPHKWTRLLVTIATVLVFLSYEKPDQTLAPLRFKDQFLFPSLREKLSTLFKKATRTYSLNTIGESNDLDSPKYPS